ncbi:MAG: aldehyde dehydrogenase family protein [Kineosporiaceae bacterium]|nr:aldehyde dehydrogenase family protein [Kineosporiaceae bacterium]
MPLAPGGTPRALAMVERAEWAARAFARYDIATVRRIAHAAALAGAAQACRLAEEAVRETGFGVVEHKVVKNESCSIGLWQAYGDHDYVSPRIDEQAKILRVPRPAGVILALTPSTNPVATTFSKIMFGLLTRNAIVISPHPYAAGVCAEAATVMAQAAVAAGAPDGCVQVVTEPSVPLVDALMASSRVSLIVATGGTAMVRAAHSSGNPALGVGPGNVPVLVDATADPGAAATAILDSKAFDNSVLCTNESVLIVVESVADALEKALTRQGAHLTSPAETDAVRAVIFDGDRLRTEWIGREATAIAAAAGIRVPARTRVLITPIDLVVPEEALAHEKLLPVLALTRVPTAERGIDVARAVLRISGQGHSAAIHSRDAATVMAFGSSVPVMRISVNVGNSLGSSGFHTNLAPTMTIGTGFTGRSALTANLAPEHLVAETQVAYGSSPATPMPSFSGLDPWYAPDGPVPQYPVASNLDDAASGRSAGRGAEHASASSAGANGVAGPQESDELRDHLRRLIVEELRAMVKG